MNKIHSWLLFGLFKLLSFCPLRLMYVFSDLVLYPIIYHIVGYRTKIVEINLRNSFPEMSIKELKNIEKRFYHHFCDCFFESIRILSMSKKESMERMVFLNTEIITDCIKKGQGVIVVLGHYGNWEFQNFVYHHMDSEGKRNGFSVYMPLRSEAFDYLYMKIRTRFQGRIVTKKGVFREVIKLKNAGECGIFGLVSDQSPIISDLHYWTKFLNQETAVITGFEKMAKQTNMAVIYADVKKLGRGRYQTEYIMISENPGETKPFEIVEKYAGMMEKTILRDPAFWLWTHKRWKHKRSDAENL